MVKKLFSLLHREWNGLHEAAILIGGFTILSQVLALFRDRLLAHLFGAGPTLDLYYAAFRIPDFVFAGVASFMSALVLIPILAKKAEESDARAQKFLSDTFTVFFTILVVVSVGVYMTVPWLTSALFPNFVGVEHADLVIMTRLLLLSPILLGLSNLFGSVTQMFRKFFAFGLAPVFYNVGIILGAGFFYPAFGIIGLAWGVVLGAFATFFIHFFVSYRQGFSVQVSFLPSFIDMWEIFRVSLPRTIGLAANQFTLIALIAFAAIMERGSVTVFNFALNLQSVPVAIVGMSYATAAFPALSRHFAKEEMDKFLKHMLVAARHIIFWSLPMLVLLIVLRAQIVRTVLGSGSFDWGATKLTAACLALFAVSIVAQSVTMLFVRGFYATGQNRIPLFVNVLTSVFTIAIGYGLFVWYARAPFLRIFVESLLRVDGVAGTSVLTLPLAYSVGMILNAVLLMSFFRKHFGVLPASLKNTFVHGLFASLIAGLVAYEFLEVFGLYLNLETFWGIFMQGLGAGIAGILTWWIILELMDNSEIKEVREALTRKFWKTRVVFPGREEL
ncbi:MAG: Integral membrane protein MviN [Parcubacteria group bacterium GW2011_GWA2_49_16]|nr:MAG: Integral membrane protein MviN [Parcubacteria group bacterium GW2011_GWA2_49_16]